MFGWKQQELMGANLSEFIVPVRYRERHKKGMEHFMQTGQTAIINKQNNKRFMCKKLVSHEDNYKPQNVMFLFI